MLYIITDGTNYKLGYSQNPASRLKELQTANAKPLVLLGTTEGELEDEKRYHKLLSNTQLVGEWFSPSSELFEILIQWSKVCDTDSLAQSLVLSYLFRNNISQTDILDLAKSFSSPFILQAFICQADFTTRFDEGQEGLIKNLVKQHWVSVNKPAVHPWAIQRQYRPIILTKAGILAEIQFNKDATELASVIKKFNCSERQLNTSIAKALNSDFSLVKRVFKFVVDELKATNDLGLLTTYRQRQMGYRALFDKLASGKLPPDPSDDYFTTLKPAMLGEEITWLGAEE